MKDAAPCVTANGIRQLSHGLNELCTTWHGKAIWSWPELLTRLQRQLCSAGITRNKLSLARWRWFPMAKVKTSPRSLKGHQKSPRSNNFTLQSHLGGSGPHWGHLRRGLVVPLDPGLCLRLSVAVWSSLPIWNNRNLVIAFLLVRITGNRAVW